MVIENDSPLLSEEEIDFLLSQWDEDKAKHSIVFDRRYMHCLLANIPPTIQDKFYNWIELKLGKTIFDKHNFLILHKYSQGDFFNLHKDDGIRNKGKRLYAAGFNLNNNYSGGEFIVRYQGKEKTIGTVPGTPYLFSSDVLHKINHVKTGIRWSILMFLFENDFLPNKKKY